MIVGLVCVGEVLPLVVTRSADVRLRLVSLVSAHLEVLVSPRLDNDQVSPVPGEQVADEEEGGKELEESDGQLRLAHCLRIAACRHGRSQSGN